MIDSIPIFLMEKKTSLTINQKVGNRVKNVNYMHESRKKKCELHA